ncbi:MAG: extracellular solute-binding protein [Caldilineaceae bacterium]|nr:extracellular solute-binding protein [Caldilineaceae bacterium]
MRTKVLTVFGLLLVMGIVLAGCAPVVTVQQGAPDASTAASALTDEPVELTVRAFSFQLKPDRGRAGDQLRAWASAHPNVKLNVQSVDDFNGDVLATDVAAGTAPDLVFAEGGAVQPLLTSGQLLDLSPWYDVAELEKDYLPDYWNNFMAYEGKLYGIYQDTEARVVYYRPDFLAEAGLAAPANGWSYAEMRDYARQLTTADRAGVCIGKEGYIELAMTVANGLNFGEDFTYDNEAVRAYYQFLSDLIADGSTPAEQVGLTRDQCAQLFAAGKVAMIFLHSNGITSYTSGSPALLNPEQIGVVSLPVLNAGDPFGTFGGGFMWVVPAKEYSAAQLATIKDLLQYMTSQDSQVSYALFRGFLLARKSYMAEINRLVVEDPGVSSSIVGAFYPTWIEIAQNNLTSIPRDSNTTVYRLGLAAGLEVIQAGQSVDNAVQAATDYFEANKK